MSRVRSATSFILGACLVLLSLSCQKPRPVSSGQPFTLHVKQAARLTSSDLDLYFRRVAADSRCPRDVQCIAAGDAVVTLDARLNKGYPVALDVRLPGGTTSAPDTAQWTIYEGYRIRLVRLEPYPNTRVPADTSSYVATLVVEPR
jgi:hypothetical protein